MSAVSMAGRLAKLEAKAGMNGLPPPDVVVRLVKPNGSFGGETCQSDRAQSGGRVWHRERDETDKAFADRVLAEVPRRSGEAALVVMFPADDLGECAPQRLPLKDAPLPPD